MAIENIPEIVKETYQGQNQRAEVTSKAVSNNQPKIKSAIKTDTSVQTGSNELRNEKVENSGTQNQIVNESIKKAVEDINKSVSNSEAIFGIHEETNRVTIKIVDKTSKKILKEFPPEKTLDMIVKVWEMAGLMVDEKR